ncbi:MAG: family 20 glycosylhydrolase [Ginsengibacter sp.]
MIILRNLKKNIFQKKPATFILSSLFICVVCAQTTLPTYPDNQFSTYYLQKKSFAESLPLVNKAIVFVGNSITDGAQWSELFNDPKILSRGFSGDVSAGVLNRLHDIVNRKPSKIFLLIGTNDLATGITTDSLLRNILLMADYTKQQSPLTQFYVLSILPVNDTFGKFSGHTKNVEKILETNQKLKENASKHAYTFVDLHTSFADKNGKLSTRFTNDGLHLSGDGYLLWKHKIYPHVYNQLPRPALIPLPQKIQWTEKYFSLKDVKTIVNTHSIFQNESALLQNEFFNRGWKINLSSKKDKNPFIELKYEKTISNENNEEAYKISVKENSVTLTASTAHGMYYAIQTLRQLMRDNVLIDGCEIIDWPAFSWRGYMVDVGRNFQSLPLLKQQIDVLGQYKLNIFHFHFTEDIAWRLESKKYPELTAPEHMLRNIGLFYSEAELKELIAYCKERHITLVPEIDMPGHSAAFKRATGFDMQSDSGLIIVKEVLKEFLTTYDLPYFHVGGDEVKVTNHHFMPEVLKLVQGFGPKTIAWSPGAPVDDKTIRQLWLGDQGETSRTDLRFIDSRHLYLNHMDPLETVPTLFFRQIGNQTKESINIPGAILCLWPDRRVEKEDDILSMNGTYPGLVTFAERTWHGGGMEGWVSGIGTANSTREKEFEEFEKRLLEQKQLYFYDKIFPYQKQSGITWKLFGPFKNDGDLSKTFPPENTKEKEPVIKPTLEVIGGTIILRHWWAPLIEGALKSPEKNTTWYATTRIWSEEERIGDFWIGFNDLSRSYTSASPKKGTWDNRQSKVWVNGKEIAPPDWKRAGMEGNSEVPLIDEGYSYRPPTKIALKKGWNQVIIKAPIGNLKTSDWRTPEKWMFTFVEVKG